MIHIGYDSGPRYTPAPGDESDRRAEFVQEDEIRAHALGIVLWEPEQEDER